jgi:hypothetical protein
VWVNPRNSNDVPIISIGKFVDVLNNEQLDGLFFTTLIQYQFAQLMSLRSTVR